MICRLARSPLTRMVCKPNYTVILLLETTMEMHAVGLLQDTDYIKPCTETACGTNEYTRTKHKFDEAYVLFIHNHSKPAVNVRKRRSRNYFLLDRFQIGRHACAGHTAPICGCCWIA